MNAMPRSPKSTVVLVMLILFATQLWAGGDEIRLRAELVAPDAAGDVSGKVDFRNRPQRARRQFSVQIEGLTPGQMFDVMVAGVAVGTVLIDDLGVGSLDYDDRANPDDMDEPFPANFPAIDGGEAVEIGLLDGTLQFR